MKKIITITLVLCITIAFNAQTMPPNSADTKSTALKNLPVGGRTDEGAKVPERAKLAFDRSYPNTIAAWSIGEKSYMAEYRDSLRVGHIVTYDDYGNQLSTQEEMSPGQFPVPIDKYIIQNYPNEHFVIWHMINADATNLYYFTRAPETIWFDPTGNFRNKTRNKIK